MIVNRPRGPEKQVAPKEPTPNEQLADLEMKAYVALCLYAHALGCAGRPPDLAIPESVKINCIQAWAEGRESVLRMQLAPAAPAPRPNDFEEYIKLPPYPSGARWVVNEVELNDPEQEQRMSLVEDGVELAWVATYLMEAWGLKRINVKWLLADGGGNVAHERDSIEDAIKAILRHIDVQTAPADRVELDSELKALLWASYRFGTHWQDVRSAGWLRDGVAVKLVNDKGATLATLRKVADGYAWRVEGTEFGGGTADSIVAVTAILAHVTGPGGYGHKSDSIAESK